MRATYHIGHGIGGEPCRTQPARRQTADDHRKHYSAEDKIRIVVEGLRGEDSIDPEVLANPPLTVAKGPMAGTDLWRDPRLQTLPNEVLVIWGAEDKVNPADGALLFQRLIPRCDTYIFSKCGHWAQWEYADKFNSVVKAYLA